MTRRKQKGTVENFSTAGAADRPARVGTGRRASSNGVSLSVEPWAIDRVIPYARNPRKNDAAVAAVAASIKEFGWRQPIVVDEDGVVLAGHTRLAAARSLGMHEVPVHVAAGLTPAQAKAYRLADNRTNENAEWDDALLGLELADLRIDDFDLALTGFTDDELTKLLDGLDAGDPGAGEGEGPATYALVVDCATADEREALRARLTDDGYACRFED